MFSDALVSQFHRARLDLKVTAAPLINAGNAAIVQLDIARNPQQFLLWKGDQHNQLIVQGTDRKLQQLVLFVKEPRRSFEARVRKEQVAGRKILRKENNGHFVWVEQFTDSAQRHLLCGMDEQHYFVAQLPFGASTVQEAHQALFNPAAGQAARKAGAKLIRQGEWFFVRASVAELKALEPLLGKKFPIQRRVAASDGTGAFRRGRAHVADELIRLKDVTAPLVPGSVYVKGKIRHPDHWTLELYEWHRVFGNAEASQPVGVQWAD
jgi:hypothetical protein